MKGGVDSADGPLDLDPPATSLAKALVVFGVSAGLVLGAGAAGAELLRRSDHPLARGVYTSSCFSNWDGQWYLGIAERGYFYEPGRPSSVVFPPLYPLLGRFVSAVAAMPAEAGLLVVSWLALLAAMFLLLRYAAAVHPDMTPAEAEYALVALALFPPTFFFRMAYSESLFLLLCLVAMLGLHRRWPPEWVAAAVALATLTRVAGVMLAVPLTVHALRAFGGGRRSWRVVLTLAIAGSGLAGYAAYLGWRFGDPLAFVRTHGAWGVRPPTGALRQLLGTIALEPVWALYVPGAQGHWRHEGTGEVALASLHFANPLYVGLILAALVYGWRRRWLTPYEGLFGVGLLAFAYVTKGFTMCMAGQGRYAAVAFPAYLVFGRLLAGLPPAWGALLAAVSAVLLATYAATFCAWYLVI